MAVAMGWRAQAVPGRNRAFEESVRSRRRGRKERGCKAGPSGKPRQAAARFSRPCRKNRGSMGEGTRGRENRLGDRAPAVRLEDQETRNGTAAYPGNDAARGFPGNARAVRTETCRRES